MSVPDTYPGSKKHRGEKPWDADPKVINGVEYFKVGHLAKALGKKSVTIRSWIDAGWIPEAPFRQSIKPGTRGNAGVRLWNREQIEVIVKFAVEEGVLDDDRRATYSKAFVDRIHEWFAQDKIDRKEGRK